MTQQPEPVLSYASATPEIRNTPLLWVARVAGTLPLGVGIGTLLLFLISRIEELMLLGLWIILVGTGMVSIGFVCLLVYFFTNRVKDREMRRRVNRQTGWALLLMIANFPVAYGCVIAGVWLAERSKLL